MVVEIAVVAVSGGQGDMEPRAHLEKWLDACVQLHSEISGSSKPRLGKH